MAVTVTLHVYSGRPDPTWTLSDADAAALEKQVGALEQPTLSKPPGTLGMLGYRGFSVSGIAAAGGAPLDLYVHEGVVDRGSRFDVNVVDEKREIEQLLVRGAPRDIAPETLQHTTTEITRPPQSPQPQGTPAAGGAAGLQPTAIRWPFPWPWPWPPINPCPTCHAADAPAYQPMLWNIPGVQPFNNCYNYANNRITNTFAQPGRAHAHMYTILQCNGGGAVEPASVADGLVASPNFTANLAPGHGWYVALVIWPGVDFHWYRQDRVGCWSHKPGGTAARNTDNAGHTISDPKTANRGPYVNFCTYMITHNGMVIN